MAQVPRVYDPVQNRPVAPGYQSDAGAPPDAFGALQAQGAIKGGAQLGAFGDDLAHKAVQAQVFDNERALKQADVTLADKIRTITYGDGTAENPGYYASRGDNAVNGAKPTMDALQQAHADVLSSITNPRVAAMFKDVGQGRVVAAQSSVGSFLDQQRLVANNGASVARMDSATNDAAAAWNDPKQLAHTLDIQRNEVADFAKRNGLNEDEAAKMLRDQTTKTFSNVIKAAGRVDAQTALKVFNEYKDQIPGDALPGLEREIRTDMRFEAADQERRRAQAERDQVKAVKSVMDEYITKAIDPNVSVGLDLHALANDPRLAGQPEAKRELYMFNNSVMKGEASSAVSRETYSEIFQRIYAPDATHPPITSPSDLIPYVIDQRLNRSDLDAARKEMAFASDPAVATLGPSIASRVKAVQQNIQGTTPLGTPNPNGAIDANNFLYDALAQLKAAKANKEDLTAYVTPGSPKDLGRPENVARFMGSMSGALKAMTDALSRPAGEGSTEGLSAGGTLAPKAGGGVVVPLAGATDLTSKEGIKAAYVAGKITRAQAEAALVKGGHVRD